MWRQGKRIRKMHANTLILIVERGPLVGHRFPVPSNGLLLGRSSRCDLAFLDPSLSRRHCRLEWRGMVLWVVDLNSANQTLVNGQPIHESPLMPNDTITVGETTLRVRQEEVPTVSLSDLPDQDIAVGRVPPPFAAEGGEMLESCALRRRSVRLSLAIGGVLALLCGAGLLYRLRMDTGAGERIALPTAEFGAATQSDSVPPAPAADPDRSVSSTEADAATTAPKTETESGPSSSRPAPDQAGDRSDPSASPVRMDDAPQGEKPLPCSLRVESDPPQARVIVNGTDRGETPCVLADPKPGVYTLRVEKSGYETLTRKIMLEGGDAVTERFRLESVTGSLAIRTAPSIVTVMLDGKKVGITRPRGTDASGASEPLVLRDLPEGEHQIEVRRKGYATQRRTAIVKRGEHVAVALALPRQFIPNYEVRTSRSYYRGVLEFIDAEGIRLETAPGVTQTILLRDVKQHGALPAEE
jgi:hypothetical protein